MSNGSMAGMIKYFILALIIVVIVGVSLWCPTCREWFKDEAPVATTTPSGKLPAGLPATEMVRNVNIKEGDAITSPLVITGEARGPWFFEASFPVILTDWDGLIIAEGYAQAEGEWMTETFVPFKSTLTFTKPAYGERGTLILKKDNPSGLPENDAALEITVKFK